MHITTQCSLNSSHGNHEKPPDVLLSYNIWIPLDLTREILLRLPSKSLAKFRCVSKQWLSITTQPDFMKSFIAPWPYNCPYAGSECSVMGDIPFLVAHLRDDHKVDMNSRSSFTRRYVKSNPLEVENVTWMLCVFHCFGQYFCLHFEAFQLEMAPVYMAFLHFMGDETEARNYNYSLEVGGYDQKLTWEGTPRSVRDSHRKVRDSLDGLIVQRDMALFFSGEGSKELKLKVTGRIWSNKVVKVEELV